MIFVQKLEDLSLVNNNNIDDLDWDSLLKLYNTIEFNNRTGEIFTIILIYMYRRYIHDKKQYKIDWIIKNIGIPDYYCRENDNFDLYYALPIANAIGCIQIRGGDFVLYMQLEPDEFKLKIFNKCTEGSKLYL